MTAATEFAQKVWIETDAYDPHDAANGPGTAAIRRVGLPYEIEASMGNAGWIVVSETAWPGWRAYVDGARVRTHFANHGFR